MVLAAACVALLMTALAARKREKELRSENTVGRQRTENLAQALHEKDIEHAQTLRDRDIEIARLDAEALKLREMGEHDKQELEKLQASFRIEFRNLAQDILEEKSKQFRQTNRESLDQLLSPFRESITEFKKRVEDIYSDENQQRGALKAELHNLKELNRRITDQTANLTDALRGNSKVQGDWGEMILDTILEGSNLKKNIHYFTQAPVKDAEGNDMRPDVILKLPDEKSIVIDSKVSLTAYVNYTGSEDESARRQHLAEHLRSIRGHVNELGKKSYQDKVLGSPDFVIMFVPTEPAFLAAVNNDSEIWADAYRKKVIVSSPTNLFGVLKIVDDLWKRDDLSRNANRIAKEGAMMYEKFVGFAETLETIGKNLDTVQKNYGQAMKQLRDGKGNLVGRAQKLYDLNIKVSKSLPASMVEDAEEDGESVNC
jgi:DNA recombination protein RmuC